MNAAKEQNSTYSLDAAASLLMLGYVVSMSFAPLFVALGAEESPFVFSSAWRVGLSTGYALILSLAFRETLFSRKALKAILSRTVSFSMLLWIANSLWTAVFAWSTQYISVATATALCEAWPALLAVFTSWLFRRERRWREITPKTLIMFAAAFLGIALVIAAQVGGVGALVSLNSDLRDTAKGVGLATVATVLLTLRAFGFRWTVDLASDLSDGESGRRMEMFGVAVGVSVSSLLALPFTAVTGFARGEFITASATAYGSLGGLLLGCLGTFCWRIANLTARDLGINAMAYLTPALSLVWLFAFNQIGEVDVFLLILGIAVIIAANVGVYVESKRRESES